MVTDFFNRSHCTESLRSMALNTSSDSHGGNRRYLDLGGFCMARIETTHQGEPLAQLCLLFVFHHRRFKCDDRWTRAVWHCGIAVGGHYFYQWDDVCAQRLSRVRSYNRSVRAIDHISMPIPTSRTVQAFGFSKVGLNKRAPYPIARNHTQLADTAPTANDN